MHKGLGDICWVLIPVVVKHLKYHFLLSIIIAFETQQGRSKNIHRSLEKSCCQSTKRKGGKSCRWRKKWSQRNGYSYFMSFEFIPCLCFYLLLFPQTKCCKGKQSFPSLIPLPHHPSGFRMSLLVRISHCKSTSGFQENK